MIKVITLLKRKDGLTPEQFSRYWREEHGPLALKQYPQVIKYVQNHVRHSAGEEPVYDGIAETYWGSLETFEAALQAFETGSAAVQAELTSLQQFVDLDKMLSLVTEEDIIKQPA